METEKRSNVSLENREKLILTGVLEVVSFSEEKILLQTSLGNLDIKGKEMKINKLDVKNGDVTINGNINSVVYNTKEYSNKNIIKKIFK